MSNVKFAADMLTEVRCPDCQKLLGKVSGHFEFKCVRCSKPGHERIIRGLTCFGWVVAVNNDMPQDQVKFVNDKGKVFQIVNLGQFQTITAEDNLKKL